MEVIGRLAPVSSLTQAQAEFDTFTRRIAAAYPELGRQRIVLARYSATAYGPWQGGQARMFMADLTGVALLTLLVVCATSRTRCWEDPPLRQRELAVRQSLGASRRRVLSLLLAEGLVLSLAAAAAAWAFALGVARAIPALLPPLESGAHMEPNVAPGGRGRPAPARHRCGEPTGGVGSHQWGSSTKEARVMLSGGCF